MREQESKSLGHADKQVKLAVRRGDVRLFEQEELNLPNSLQVDSERVRQGPVLAVPKGHVDGGPSGAVHLHGFVGLGARVIHNLDADEVDADSVAHVHRLVVHDAQEDSSGLGDIKAYRVARGVSAGTVNVKLSERRGRCRPRNNIEQSESREQDACEENHDEDSINGAILAERRSCDLYRG